MTDKSRAAFPVDKQHPYQKGMSLRDYFAGQALAGFRAHPANPDTPKTVAMFCYGIADAMLAEKDKS
ncbi:MAG: hypothetical protein GY941_11455 [Planctomycetes bacterium]|nr:hypothetical protein [Planctomycetota bacterium]